MLMLHANVACSDTHPTRISRNQETEREED